MIVPVKRHEYIAQGNEIVTGCAIASIFLIWTTVKSSLILVAFSGGKMGLTPFILFLKTKTCSIKTFTFSNSRSCCTPGKHGQGFELFCPEQVSLLLRVPLSRG